MCLSESNHILLLERCEVEVTPCRAHRTCTRPLMSANSGPVAEAALDDKFVSEEDRKPKPTAPAKECRNGCGFFGEAMYAGYCDRCAPLNNSIQLLSRL